AEDVFGYLVIDPGRIADEETGRREAAACSYGAVRPIAIAGSKTAIDAKIEARPVVDSRRQRGRKICRRDVCRECMRGGGHDNRCCGNKRPPHATLPDATSDAVLLSDASHRSRRCSRDEDQRDARDMSSLDRGQRAPTSASGQLQNDE